MSQPRRVLGVMQPYFFPYVGYFALIARSTDWIVFDTAQYIRHGWVNRNRVLHPTDGWQYVTVPVSKAPRDTPIGEIELGAAWDRGGKILGQLEHYRRRAPRFEAVRALVAEVLDHDERSLTALDVRALERVCAELALPFAPRRLSELALELGEIRGPWDWALRIAEAVGADEYVNPPGAGDRFDRDAFADAGVELTIVEPPPLRYDTPGYTFEPGLSIIDVLMWNEPETIRAALGTAR